MFIHSERRKWKEGKANPFQACTALVLCCQLRALLKHSSASWVWLGHVGPVHTKKIKKCLSHMALHSALRGLETFWLQCENHSSFLRKELHRGVWYNGWFSSSWLGSPGHPGKSHQNKGETWAHELHSKAGRNVKAHEKTNVYCGALKAFKTQINILKRLIYLNTT